MIQLRFTCAPSLCSVACSHLPKPPCSPTHLTTHTRCQHTNRTCGTPHPTQVSHSLFLLPSLPLPSLLPSLLFLYLDALFPSSQVLSLSLSLSLSPPPPLSLRSLIRMSLLSELPHATFVVFGEGCGSFNVWCVIVCTHLCHLCTGSTTPAHS